MIVNSNHHINRRGRTVGAWRIRSKRTMRSTSTPVVYKVQLGEAHMGQYAIEVEREFANSFRIPGATIVESRPIEENNTVGFIVESKKDLRSSSVLNIPGVCGVEPL